MEISVTGLDQEEILRYLGAKREAIVPDSLHRLLQDCIERTLSVLRPQGIYRRFQIRSTAEGIVIRENGLILSGDSIQSHLADAQSVWLMAVTIGQGMDRLIRSSMLHAPEEGVIYDSCGAAAVEAAADALEALIWEQMDSEKLFLTPRFSPGYGDLPIELQRQFLTVLDAPRQIGLMTTESSHLTPSKSVTAILGVINKPFVRQLNPCDACKLRRICTLRKAGTPCWETNTELSS